MVEHYERERKYLVVDLSIVATFGEGTSIVQGYLGCAANFSYRIRSIPTLDTHLVTVKGPRLVDTRLENEYAISRDQAEIGLMACGEWLIEKTRYPVVGPDGSAWDVDVFHGRNRGLIIAELELPQGHVEFDVPPWCVRDVTNDDDYYNESLAFRPWAER